MSGDVVFAHVRPRRIALPAASGKRPAASPEPLWDICYTYVDDTVDFHYFAGDPGRPHLYPAGEPFVSLGGLPPGARDAWDAFWQAYAPAQDGPRPRGRAREIEQAFFRLTGTTPIDLDDNAFDLRFYLAAGQTGFLRFAGGFFS